MKTQINFVLCMLICMIMLLGYNCTNKDIIYTNENQYTRTYADSVFLGFEGDLYNPDVLWKNVDIYLLALNRMRMNLKFKKNKIVWDFRSASDLKMSENIYTYIIEAWEAQNKKLESNEYSIIFSRDGYGYKIEPKKSNLSSRAFAAIILRQGMHRSNMKALKNLPPLPLINPLKLSYIVDIEKSDFSGDGAGGVQITGRGGTNKVWWSYYCCNACAWNPTNKVSCSRNDILEMYNDKRGDISYFFIRNIDHLPLITLQNPQNFGE